jgi:general secretion pathway protein G
LGRAAAKTSVAVGRRLYTVSSLPLVRGGVMVGRRVHHGFTLIELLVALGVVSLLMAIVFPVFGAARGMARRTQCISNLRQLGQAISMYASDYDELFPYGTDPEAKFTAPVLYPFEPDIQGAILQMRLLPDVMAAYVRHRELWHCPSDRGGALVPGDVEARLYPSVFERFGMSYAYGAYPIRAAIRHVPTTALGAEVPILEDIHARWHGGEGLQGRYNVLFGDGHVKNINYIQFIRIYSPESPPSSPNS